MKKVILVDGNNLMFRSYYATAYSGNIMKNSKGMPTNALYGFVNMMNKIINEEDPKYIAVAFDIGVNFRRQKYETYKAGRNETPEDLVKQMPIAKDILDGMGIRYFEMEPYEADDIIGTLARMANEDPEYDATIVSSDKDLLQLITDVVDVKLLKQKGHIRYNPTTFKEDWRINPIEIIDYKALAGDSSDNIPGVRGVGDKTALSLLEKYGTIENLYEHIDEVKGKLKDKLLEDKANAFMSKEMATIYCEVPLKINFEELAYTGPTPKLADVYRDLEFHSLLKNVKEEKKEEIEEEFTFEMVKDVDKMELRDKVSFYIECDETNYHQGFIVGMAICDEKHNYYISPTLVKEAVLKLEGKQLYTFDYKKEWVLLKRLGISLDNVCFDLMIAAYLLDYSEKDDIAYLMNNEGIQVSFYDQYQKSGFSIVEIVKKARFILENYEQFESELKQEEMYELYTEIEHPLIEVLADMEYTGITCDKQILDTMQKEVTQKIEKLTNEIYELAGEEFNISSPFKLGNILFEKLGLPHGKKIIVDTVRM